MQKTKEVEIKDAKDYIKLKVKSAFGRQTKCLTIQNVYGDFE